jgi:hypothetical protein
MFKNTHKTTKNNKKQQKKPTTLRNRLKKTSETALSLQLFLMANFDRVNGPIDMTDYFH